MKASAKNLLNALPSMYFSSRSLVTRVVAMACLMLALPAQAVLVDAGTLYLELNNASSQVRWGDRPGGEDDVIQPLRVVKKCEVDEQLAGDADLISLVGSGTVGLSFNSLGIASSKGVGCGRLESRIGGQQVNQSLTLGFSSALSSIKAIQVSLDLELKGDVEATLITSLDGTQTGAWSLLSGGNAVGAVGCDAANGETCETGDVNVLCPSSSDSGSDNAGSDNCRVVLNVEADTVFIQALDGELGLEGGGDSGTQASQFDLAVEFEGELNCLENVTVVPTDPDDDSYNLTLRRLTNLDGSQCDLIPYDLDFDGKLINFEKLDLGQLIAHDINVQFDDESIPTPSCYPSCTNLGLIPSTLQQFSGAPTEIAIPACTGTPEYYIQGEASDPDGVDLAGQLKIITPPAGGWVDLEPSLPGLQHGCWYDQDIDLLGPDPDTPYNIIIRVSQKIYLIGDWAARRGIQ